MKIIMTQMKATVEEKVEDDKIESEGEDEERGKIDGGKINEVRNNSDDEDERQ